MTKRLLIADDALLIRTMIRDIATDAGWEVVGEAANGQQAIELYQATKPDVATLDLVMPDYDGMHALRGIREYDPNAKVVIVSALNQKELLAETFGEGASDFICKPFAQEQLLSTLEALLSSEEDSPADNSPAEPAPTTIQATAR